jgi:hypothetical protein
MDWVKGIAAGAVATAVLTGLIIAQAAVGFVPQLDMVALLAVLVGASPHGPVGWILHGLLGTLVWGALFAWLAPRLPGEGCTRRGTIFGVLVWLVLMLGLLPAAGTGFFALRSGAAVPLAMLAMHVVYGAVLGWTFGRLRPAFDLPGILMRE